MITSQLVGQPLSEKDLRVLMEELNNISAKWNNLGLQLGVSVGRLNAIKKDHHTTSDCLRETLTTWLKTFSSPSWSAMVDALKSRTVGEVNLAVELEQKYCLTQDTSIAAIYHHAPPPPPVIPSQSLTWTTPPPQYTIPPIQPPVLAYSVTSPSHPPPWSVPYYCLPHTSYPMSTPFPLHPSCSQVSQVTPTSSGPLLPSVPAQVTMPQFRTNFHQFPSSSYFNLTLPDISPSPPPATVTTASDLPPPVTTHTLGMKLSCITLQFSIQCCLPHLKSIPFDVYIAMYTQEKNC